LFFNLLNSAGEGRIAGGIVHDVRLRRGVKLGRGRLFFGFFGFFGAV
jgi:hypothetical protein